MESSSKVIVKNNDNWISNLKIGDKARFFHPCTLGVMHQGEVIKIYENGDVKIRFFVTYNGKSIFRTFPDNIK